MVEVGAGRAGGDEAVERGERGRGIVAGEGSGEVVCAGCVGHDSAGVVGGAVAAVGGEGDEGPGAREFERVSDGEGEFLAWSAQAGVGAGAGVHGPFTCGDDGEWAGVRGVTVRVRRDERGDIGDAGLDVEQLVRCEVMLCEMLMDRVRDVAVAGDDARYSLL